MIVTDFIFDGVALSSLGYMIVDLNSSGGFREAANATRTFQNVSMFNGKFMPFTVTTYADRLEFNFDIIKLTCNGSDGYIIHTDEARYLMRWLARPKAYKFKMVCDEYANVFFEGSFNVTDIFVGDDRIGLRLTFVTNRPFGTHTPLLFTKTFESTDDFLDIVDISDDAGSIYPYIMIKCNEGGNLCLSNSFDERDMIINGCSEGETIIITEELILGTDNPLHKIQNDFNYEFLKISNNYYDRLNRITCTMKCDVTISYQPVAKVVI